MSQLQMQFLGTFQVLHNGRSLSGFRSDKIRALLVYLAVEANRPHRRDSLATLLWPDMDDQKARDNLRLSLFRLRQVLGEAETCLQIDRQSVQFNSEQCAIDVLTFTQAITAVRHHPHSQLENCSDCMAQLETAVHHYQGEFLPGFFLEDDLHFSQWVMNQREWLHQEALHALYLLTNFCQQNGRLPIALNYARRQLELEPWREEAHRQLMCLLASSNQRANALAQYETCRRILHDELGIEPAAETEELHAAIRTDALTPPAETIAIQAETGLLPSHLPPQSTPFIGRLPELTALSHLIADPTAQLITIVAAGGMGKTRLALAAAASLREQTPEQFPHGFYFVSLTAVLNSQHLIPTIAEALGVQLEQSHPPQEQLLNYLANKQLLLILDNFEQLLNDAASLQLLSNLLPRTPQTQWLVTSRERLQLKEEFVFPLAGLHYPETDVLDVETHTAVQLFLQSIHRLQPQFSLSDSDLPHLITICRLLEGMPLGIELAATWVDMLPLTEIASEIKNSLDFLASNLRNLPERHRSMRAVFDTSWERLSQAERSLFRQLTVFRGGFTRAAAQQVAGTGQNKTAVWRILSALVSKSLLHYDQKADRYAIHELLRQYGQERLEAQGETAVAQTKHSHTYCRWLADQTAALKGSRQKATLSAIETDLENCRAAWNWAVQQAQADLLAQAAFSLGIFFWRRGRHQEGETAFASAAQQLTHPPEHPLILAQMWHWQATFVPVVELRQQLLTQALAHLESTAVSINSIRADKAAILLELGSVTHSQGDHMTAERLYEQSLSLYRIAGDKWGEANALYEMGVSAWSQGYYVLAEQRHNQSLQIRRTLQDDIGIAQSLEGLSGSNMFHGHMAKAIDLAQQSLAVYRQLDDRVGTAVLQAEVGHKTWCQKLEGLDLVEDSLRIFAGLGTRHHTAHWTVILAMYKADVDIAEAELLAESGLALCQEIGYQRGIAIAHGVLSRVAWLRQEYDQAQKMAQIYLHMAEEMNWPLERSDALTWSSWAYLATGDQQQAKCQMYTVLQTPNLWRIAGLDITAVLLSHQTPTTAIYQRAWQLIGHGQSRYARHRGAVSLTMLHRFMPKAMMALPAEAIATAKAAGSQLSSAELFAELLISLQRWSSMNQAV